MTWQLQPNTVSIFLNKTILKIGLIDIDYWSGVHLFSGMILATHVKDWRKVLALLILYEIFELLYVGILFRFESIPNIVIDVLIGMLGFYLIRRGK